MGIIVMALNAIIWLIIGDAILSWMQSPDQMPRKLTSQFTEMIYKPIHSVISPKMTGGIDLSPIVVIVVLQMLIGFLQ
jgi:uncharacterized protein YggT (Ycf19 family)